MKVMIAVESEYFAEEQVKFINEHIWPENLSFKIVHLVEPENPELEEFDSGKFINEIANIKMERGRRLVKDTAQKIGLKFPKAVITEEVAIGNPKDCLLESIEEWQADTVIVGSHGRRELERYNIGSVSSAILAYAKCSVIVVRPYMQYLPAS